MQATKLKASLAAALGFAVICATIPTPFTIAQQIGGGAPPSFQQAGTPLGAAATINCSTNLTCTITGGVLTIVAAGGSGGGTVTVVGAGALTITNCVTGGGTTTVQTPSVNCTVDSSGNVKVNTLTSGQGSGTTGTVALTGATSGNAVTLTVLATTAAATLTLPSTTGTVTYTATLGTAGHCKEYGADGISDVDSGSACGAGGGGSSAAANVTPVTVSANVTSDQTLQEVALAAGLLNTLKQPYLLHGSGIFTIAALQTPTLTFKAKLCTISGCGSGTVVTLASITTAATVAETNNPWNINLKAATTATGASGTLIVHGPLAIDIGALTSIPATVYNDTNTASSSAIDLTAALFLDFTVATSAGNAGNAFTQQIATVEPASSAGTGGATATVPYTGWSIVNGVRLSNYPGANGVGASMIDNNALNWRFASRPVTVPYTLIATSQCNTPSAPPTGAQTCGFYLSDGTKLIGFELLANNVTNGINQLRVERMNSVTSDSSSVAGGTPGLVGNGFWTVKIVNDGTNRTFFYYYNGAFVQFYQELTTAFLTETVIGFGGLSVAGTTLYVNNTLLYWTGVS